MPRNVLGDLLVVVGTSRKIYWRVEPSFGQILTSRIKASYLRSPAHDLFYRIWYTKS